MDQPGHRCAPPARRLPPAFPRDVAKSKTTSKIAAPTMAVSQVERLKNPCRVWTWRLLPFSGPQRLNGADPNKCSGSRLTRSRTRRGDRSR